MPLALGRPDVRIFEVPSTCAWISRTAPRARRTEMRARAHVQESQTHLTSWWDGTAAKERETRSGRNSVRMGNLLHFDRERLDNILHKNPIYCALYVPGLFKFPLSRASMLLARRLPCHPRIDNTALRPNLNKHFQDDAPGEVETSSG